MEEYRFWARMVVGILALIGSLVLWAGVSFNKHSKNSPQPLIRLLEAIYLLVLAIWALEKYM